MLAINLSSVNTIEVGTDERVHEVRFEIGGGDAYPLNKRKIQSAYHYHQPNVACLSTKPMFVCSFSLSNHWQ